MKALLTGHSRGLGAAIADALLQRGIPVLGLARADNAFLAEGFPDLLEQVALDLADTAAVAGWIAGGQLGQWLGAEQSILLINNAGTVQPVGSMGQQDPVAIARAVSLNVSTPLMLAAAVAALPAAEQRILHVSSGAGRSAYPGWSVYCATKAALDHHARAAQMDQLPGRRICSLAPGVIDTDMQGEIRATPLAQFPLRERFESMKKEGALASAADCGERLVTYLLSPQFGALAVADLREQGA